MEVATHWESIVSWLTKTRKACASLPHQISNQKETGASHSSLDQFLLPTAENGQGLVGETIGVAFFTKMPLSRASSHEKRSYLSSIKLLEEKCLPTSGSSLLIFSFSHTLPLQPNTNTRAPLIPCLHLSRHH